MTEMPQPLLDLAEAKKPTDYAEKLCVYYEDDIKRALNYEMISTPRGGPLSSDSFLASIKLEVATNERLQRAMQAAPGSFLKSILLAAQCKLLVGGSYNLFYLIPRWNKKLGCEEVTPMIGYKGLCDLAQRHPRVHKIEAHLIYEGERFSYNPGTGQLSHEVDLLGDRDASKVIGGYARVVITEPSSTHPVMDDPVVFVMNRKEIDSVMHRSDAWKLAEQKGWKNSPWHTDWKPMAKKTLLRAVMNSGAVPKDMGVGGAIHAEDTMANLPEARPEAPRVSVQSSIRAELGIDTKPEPFEFAEEAVEAIRGCNSKAEIDALADRWQHFQGGDATVIANAVDDRLGQLG